MSVSDSITWLQTSRDSKSPSMAKLHAIQILGELERLYSSLDTCARELELREQIWQEESQAHRLREHEFDLLEQQAIAVRDEWDLVRADLERRLADAEAKACICTEAVGTPYPEGAKS